jgi:predicted RND superfamily exporter protein
VTGGPRLRAVTARILLGETVTLSAGIGIVLTAVLAVALRTWWSVAVPLASIAVGVAWLVGLLALRGEPLNALTALVPPLVTALGLSYSVHVVAEVAQEPQEPGEPARARVARALRRVALPVTITGLTTMVGFASLALSPLPAVRELGGLALAGVFLTLVASLSFTPAVLVVLGGTVRPRPAVEGLGFERVAERVARFDVRHRRAILAGAAVLFVLAAVGASRLRVGTAPLERFAPDAPVRADFEAVNRHLDGANPLTLVVEAPEEGAFEEPSHLRALEDLQRWLEAQPDVGVSTSLADDVRQLHRGFTGADELPPSRRFVSQLLFLAGGEGLDRFVDGSRRLAAVHARARVVDSESVGALVARIEERLAALPAPLRGSVTGTPVVLNGALDDVLRGQIWSVAGALVLIYGVLAALFLSLRIGALALIPNALPVVVFFGTLGALGWRLEPAASLVAPMVLGIAVDDTIHYLTRFVRDARASGDERRAARSALEVVGRPVTVTSLALCAAFLVLLGSELRSQAQLGAMAAFALGFAWLTDMLLTPALAAGLRVVTLWDLLALDLGPEPHRAIALFHGLRPGQARLVALLAGLVEVRAGERLFARGAPGDAVYAVVSGRLAVSREEAGGRVRLAELARGDVVGEIGLLGATRSADVDALEDARLLRVSQDALDRLARRSPRMAGVLRRTLSGLAAARLEKDGAGAPEALAPARTPCPPELRDAARELADAFFAPGGAEHRAALRALEAARVGAGEAAGAAAELDPAAAAGLAACGVGLDAAAAFALVPLVAAAWADGRVSAGERRAVVAAAHALGVPPDSPGLQQIEPWLTEPASETLLAHWRRTAAGLAGTLPVEERLRLRDGVLGSARRVAEAAGGLLGVASVSRREEAVLEALGAAFERAPAPAGAR